MAENGKKRIYKQFMKIEDVRFAMRQAGFVFMNAVDGLTNVLLSGLLIQQKFHEI
jgi:hypothetical protein